MPDASLLQSVGCSDADLLRLLELQDAEPGDAQACTQLCASHIPSRLLKVTLQGQRVVDAPPAAPDSLLQTAASSSSRAQTPLGADMHSHTLSCRQTGTAEAARCARACTARRA